VYRDVDYTYYLDDSQKLISSLKQEDRFVVVYWEPPGALRNIELSRTEILFRNKNPKFATKVKVHLTHLFEHNNRNTSIGGSLYGYHDMIYEFVLQGH